MPSPVSLTAISTCASLALAARTSTRPPFGVNFTAFDEQVPDDLLEPAGIARRSAGAGIDDRLEPDALGGRGRAGPCRARPPITAREVDGPHVEAQLAGDDARDVEQVLDELRLRARVALDRLERAARSVGASSRPRRSMRAQPRSR